MRLHFRKGAVVYFELNCASNFLSWGKVIEVGDTEVVFLPQSFVTKQNCDTSCGINSSDLNPCITVDRTGEIHLNRELIACWSYYTIIIDGNRYLHKNVCTPAEMSEMEATAINYYSEDGFCKGTGEFFE